MRKKSHIALANYLLHQMPESEVHKHKLSFYLGSILPDIKPSFIYKRHEYFGTIDDVRKLAEDMVNRKTTSKRKKRKYYRDLGQLSHYLSDYFTFPHNINFEDTMTEHIHYENRLKHGLRAHVKKVKRTPRRNIELPTHKEIFDFIEKQHAEYLKNKSNVENDIRNIIEVNRQAIAAIEKLHEKNKANWQYASRFGGSDGG